MKTTIIILITAVFLFGFNVKKHAEPQKNIVQLAILLDTSSSMDGLIEQAKAQLWKIVNELARSKQDGESVELHVALYEYGNDNLSVSEGHIRQVAALTNDLDQISAELFKLTTNGGNEYCGEVIGKSLNQLKWNDDADGLKIIFIAGNEPFDQGTDDFRKSCKDAIAKGIIVNTIFCGNYQEGIQTFWKEGADLADGKYMNIDIDQQLVHIPAPQDSLLIQYGTQLNETYLGYGEAGEKRKEMQEEQDVNATQMAPSVMVDRAVTKSSTQYNNATWDLVDGVKTGAVKLEDVKDEELPLEMQKMDPKQRADYLADMSGKRDQLQKEIQRLNDERTKFIAEQMKNMPDNTLDAVMLKAIREQAKAKGYTFE